MTKTILDKIRYIDDVTDEVIDSIEEVRSSVSYTLNSTTKNLTLNGSSDYEIKNINGEEYIVYGYPDKWNFDVIQGDAGLFTIDGKNVFLRGNCGIVSCLNILYMAGYFNDPQNITLNNSDDGNERTIVQKVLDNDLCTKNLNDPELNGATTCVQIVDILGLYGISAYYQTIYVSYNEIANSLRNSKGVIVSVNAQRLNSLDKIGDVAFSTINGITNHFICVTGVAYDKSGNIVGFYIANSSKEFRLDGVNIDEEDLGCDFLSVDEFNWVRSIVGGSTIITECSIKTWDSNINGTGNSLDNIIKGTSGNNILKGEAGDDVLVGNKGDDTLYGGSDNDVLIAGFAQKPGSNVDTPESLSNEELKSLINIKDNIVVSEFETEEGGENQLYGEEGDDLLIGDKGNDILVGGEGEDTIYGGDGDDILIAGNTNDTDIELRKLLSRRNDINTSKYLSSEGKASILFGNQGNDILIGDKSNDELYGGDGDDHLYGEIGNDYMNGGNNHDKLWGTNLTKEQIIELCSNKKNININNFSSPVTSGVEALYGGTGDDILIGSQGNDHIDDKIDYVYDNGHDVTDNDYMYGGDGDDHFISTRGNDYLNGGNGFDVYSINNGEGRIITINDQDGQGHIKDNGYTYAGTYKNYFGSLWTDNRGNTYIWSGVNGTTLTINNRIIVENFNNGDLALTFQTEKPPAPQNDPLYPQRTHSPIYGENPKTDEEDEDEYLSELEEAELSNKTIIQTLQVCRLGLTAFSKIFDFVKNVWFPITQQ